MRCAFALQTAPSVSLESEAALTALDIHNIHNNNESLLRDSVTRYNKISICICTGNYLTPFGWRETESLCRACSVHTAQSGCRYLSQYYAILYELFSWKWMENMHFMQIHNKRLKSTANSFELRKQVNDVFGFHFHAEEKLTISNIVSERMIRCYEHWSGKCGHRDRAQLIGSGTSFDL